MELNEYQEKAMETCTQESANPMYMLFGLGEEVGEVQGKIAKAIRKGWIEICYNKFSFKNGCPTDFKESLLKEIGDCYWMLAGLCDVLNIDVESVCQMNLDKLQDRKKRNVIVGEGDNR